MFGAFCYYVDNENNKKWLVDGGVHKLVMMCNRPVNVSPFLEKWECEIKAG